MDSAPLPSGENAMANTHFEPVPTQEDSDALPSRMKVLRRCYQMNSEECRLFFLVVCVTAIEMGISGVILYMCIRKGESVGNCITIALVLVLVTLAAGFCVIRTIPCMAKCTESVKEAYREAEVNLIE